MATKTKTKPKNEPEPEIEEEEIEATEEGEEGASKPPRKFSLKLILISVAGLIVLGGGGAAAYYVFGSMSKPKPAVDKVKPVSFFDLPDIMVNLSTIGSERTQYLKVKVVLELPDPMLREKIQPVMPLHVS